MYIRNLKLELQVKKIKNYFTEYMILKKHSLSVEIFLKILWNSFICSMSSGFHIDYFMSLYRKLPLFERSAELQNLYFLSPKLLPVHHLQKLISIRRC